MIGRKGNQAKIPARMRQNDSRSMKAMIGGSVIKVYNE